MSPPDVIDVGESRPTPPPPARRGEPFEAFYARELPKLTALARVLSRTPALGDDIAQEAMLVAYRRWGEVCGYDDPAGWVRKVCANMSTSHVRRLATEARAVGRIGSFRQPAPEPAPALESDYVWAAVRQLPERQAHSVALYYVLDLSIADIAETLGCSPGAVKVHLHRARVALANALGTQFEDES